MDCPAFNLKRLFRSNSVQGWASPAPTEVLSGRWESATDRIRIRGMPWCGCFPSRELLVWQRLAAWFVWARRVGARSGDKPAKVKADHGQIFFFFVVRRYAVNFASPRDRKSLAGRRFAGGGEAIFTRFRLGGRTKSPRA